MCLLWIRLTAVGQIKWHRPALSWSVMLRKKPNWSVCLSLIKLTDYGSTISYMWNSVMRGCRNRSRRIGLTAAERTELFEALFNKTCRCIERLNWSVYGNTLYSLLKIWPRLFGSIEEVQQELDAIIYRWAHSVWWTGLCKWRRRYKNYPVKRCA